MTLRLATPADAPLIAELHRTRIVEGFLGTLGSAFLTRLYRRITMSDLAFAHVEEVDGEIVAFCASTISAGRLYKEFLLRDSVIAGIQAFPTLVRSVPRVIETLRYTAAEGEDVPSAEVLSAAVAEGHSGRGLGRQLFENTLADLGRRGVTRAKLVVATHNVNAIALYVSLGFVEHSRGSVHDGIESTVMVWSRA